MLTKAELQELVVPNQEFVEYLEKNPFPKLSWDKFDELRAASMEGLKMSRQALGTAPDDIEEFTAEIPVRDGHLAKTWIVRPAKKTTGPLIALIHGGGFVMGDSVQFVAPARVLADLYGAVVVSLQYRLAPEAAWPTQPHDCFDSLKWCAANAMLLGADPSKGFIIGGTSAGGNLAAVCAQLAADNNIQPPLTGLWQNISFMFNHETVPEKYKDVWLARSQPETSDAIVLNWKDLPHVERIVAFDYKSPLMNPIFSKTPFKGIPRTFFQANGLDPLRDDSFIYQDLLRENGIETRLITYPGLPHAFHSVLPELSVNKKWRLDFAKGFSWLLRKDISDQEIQRVVNRHPQIGGD